MIGHDRLHREMVILLERLRRLEQDMRNVSEELAHHLDHCGTVGGNTEDESPPLGDRSVSS